MHALAAAALAALVAGANVRLDTALTAEARGGGVSAAGEAEARASMTATPRLGLVVRGATLDLAARYEPRLRTSEPFSGGEPHLLHAGEVRLDQRLSPRWRLNAVGSAAYGKVDLLLDAAREEPGQAVPASRIVPHQRSEVRLGLEGLVTPRLRLRAGAGWFATGGSDTESREIVPLHRGLRADGEARTRIGPLDELVARTEVTVSSFDPGGDARIGGAVGSWHRRMSPATNVFAGAGIAVTSERAELGAVRRRVLPVAEAGFTHGSRRLRTTEQLTLRIGPAIERLGARVDPRVEVTGQVQWQPGLWWRLGARGFAAEVSPGSGQRLGSLELRAERQIGRETALIGGFFGQAQRASSAPSLLEGGVFFGFAWVRFRD